MLYSLFQATSLACTNVVLNFARICSWYQMIFQAKLAAHNLQKMFSWTQTLVCGRSHVMFNCQDGAAQMLLASMPQCDCAGHNYPKHANCLHMSLASYYTRFCPCLVMIDNTHDTVPSLHTSCKSEVHCQPYRGRLMYGSLYFLCRARTRSDSCITAGLVKPSIRSVSWLTRKFLKSFCWSQL